MIATNILREPSQRVDPAESDATRQPKRATPKATAEEAGDCTLDEPVLEASGQLAKEPNEPVDSVCPDVSLAAEVESLGDRIDALHRTLCDNGRVVSDLVTRDELTARIHDRLAQYEENAWERRYLDPLTRGIAALHRRILEQVALIERSLRAIPSELRPHSTEFWTQGALDGVRVELETILSDFGIELIVVDGSRFDRSSQEAVKRIPTSDALRVGHVADRLAPGFRVGERVIIAERVAVFVRTSDACS